MNKEHCLINAQYALRHEVLQGITTEVKRAVEESRKEIEACEAGRDVIDAVLYVALRRAAERYKPKPVNGELKLAKGGKG